MKMSVKGKIVAGAISVGLLSGVGMAFANTDAGGALKGWYDKQFNQTVQQAGASSVAYATAKMPGLYREYEGIKTKAAEDIKNKGIAETDKGSGNISAAKKSHIDSLESAEKEILDGIQASFDKVYEDGEKTILTAGEKAQKAADTDLKSFTKGKGDAAIAKVNQDLEAATTAALGDLRTAINNSKVDLKDKLSSLKGETTDKWNAAIDAEIERVRGEINTLVANLVNAQETLIATAALEKENAAKAAMDGLVGEMFK